MTETGIEQSQTAQPDLSSVPNQSQDSRLYTDDEVNRIAAKKKNDGYEKGFKDAAAQYQPQAQAIPQQNYGQQQQVGGMNQMSEAQVQQMIANHHQNLLAQQQQAQDVASANHLAQTYFSKLQPSKGKYSDFDDVVGKLNYQAPGMANIVHAATGLDNTGDVMYDLSKNPEKLASMMLLAERQPAIAQQKLQSLSASIKQNEAAQNVQMPDEPLSQNKPSNVGSDTGKLSMRDLKAKYRA